MDKSTKSKFIEAAPWGVASRFVGLGVGLVASVLIVRGLGSYQYGIYSLVVAIMGYVSLICGFGLSRSLLRFLPEIRVNHSLSTERKLIYKIITTQLLLITIAGFIFLFSKGSFNLLFKVEFKYYILLGVLVSGFIILREDLTQVLLTKYKTKLLTIASLIYGLILLLLLVFWNNSVSKVLIAQFVALGIVILFLIRGSKERRNSLVGSERAYPVRDKICNEVAFKTPSKSPNGVYSIHTKRLIKYSSVFVVASLINLIVQRQSEVFFIGYYLSLKEVGFYNLAYSLPQLALEFIPGAIWSLGLVSFSEAFIKDPQGLQKSIKLYYKLIFTVVIPVALIGALLSDKLVLLLYGEQMLPAANLSRLFFLVHSLGFIALPMGTAMYTIEKAWVGIPIGIFSAAVNIALNILLISRYGMMGGVASVFLTAIISAPLYIKIYARHIGGLPIPTRYLLKCLLSTVFLVILIPVRQYINSFLSFFAISFFAIILLLLGMKIFRLFGEEEIGYILSSNLPKKNLIIKILR